MKKNSRSLASFLVLVCVFLVTALILQTIPAAAMEGSGSGRRGGGKGEGGRGGHRGRPEGVMIGVAVEGEDSVIPVDIIIGGGPEPRGAKGEDGAESEDGKRGMLIMFNRPFPLKIKKFSPDSKGVQFEAEIIKREQRGEESSPEKSAKPSVFKIGEISLALPKTASEKKGAPGDDEGAPGGSGKGSGGRGQTAGLVGKMSIKAGDMEIDSQVANYKLYMRPIPDMMGD